MHPGCITNGCRHAGADVRALRRYVRSSHPDGLSRGALEPWATATPLKRSGCAQGFETAKALGFPRRSSLRSQRLARAAARRRRRNPAGPRRLVLAARARRRRRKSPPLDFKNAKRWSRSTVVRAAESRCSGTLGKRRPRRRRAVPKTSLRILAAARPSIGCLRSCRNPTSQRGSTAWARVALDARLRLQIFDRPTMALPNGAMGFMRL